ncbi:MAG: YezD family protein [Methylotenera sp.]|nr:YezD family protein [Methylotenera sp.]
MSNSQTINNVNAEILRAVEDLKNDSGFGSIEVLVHDDRVTQIEKREKQRFIPSK